MSRYSLWIMLAGLMALAIPPFVRAQSTPPVPATAEYAQVVYQLEKLTERVDARLSAIDATLTAFKADALTQQNHAMEAVREDLAETQALLAKTRCATGTQ